jgi:hypothetical protein
VIDVVPLWLIWFVDAPFGKESSKNLHPQKIVVFDF